MSNERNPKPKEVSVQRGPKAQVQPFARGPEKRSKWRKEGSPGRAKGRNKGSPLISVLDPALLASELRKNIDDAYGGSVRAAAIAVGLSQQHLNRFVQDSSGALGSVTNRPQKVSVTVFEKLAELLKERPNAATGAFITQDALLAGEAYKAWMLRHRAIAFADTGTEKGVPDGRLGLTWDGRVEEFSALVKRARAVSLPVTGEMEQALVDPSDDGGLAGALLGMLRGIRTPPKKRATSSRRGIAPERIVVAILRVFEPLLAVQESGWVERRGDELSDKEFSEFVRKGWDREVILLNRDSDLARMQRASQPLSELDQDQIFKAMGWTR